MQTGGFYMDTVTIIIIVMIIMIVLIYHNHENHHENHHHLIGWSQVSLMVCVVTPSPLRFKGTSSGLT